MRFMGKERLSEIYQNHHRDRSRYGYLFCEGARGPILQRWIGKGKKVLDLGCRDGMLTKSFLSNNEVIGVDIDKTALSMAEKRLKIKTLWLDLNNEWPFEGESFDCIVACEILEHLFFLEPFLQNVKKTLKRGGLFLGSVPNAFRFKNRLRFLWGKEYENDPTHVRQFSFRALKELLASFSEEKQILPLEGKIFWKWRVKERTPPGIARLFGRDLLFKVQNS